MPAALSWRYSLSLFRKVLRLMPKTLAAWVRFPFMAPSVFMMRSRSISQSDPIPEGVVATAGAAAAGTEAGASSKWKWAASRVCPPAINTARSTLFSNSRTLPRHGRLSSS